MPHELLLNPVLKNTRVLDLMHNLPEQLCGLKGQRVDLIWEVIMLPERLSERIIRLVRRQPQLDRVTGVVGWWDTKPGDIVGYVARGVAMVVNEFAQGGVDVLHTRYPNNGADYWDGASFRQHTARSDRSDLSQELAQALVRATYVPVNLNVSDAGASRKLRREHNGLLRSGSGDALVRRIERI